MLVHPALARLRGEGLPAQPRTEAALAGWRADHAPVLAELAALDQGAALADLPALGRLMGDQGAAAAMAERLITPLTDALAIEPLAQLPLAHTSTPALARLQLAAHGRAALTLAAYALRLDEQPVSALFEDCMAHEIIIAGQGRALVHRLAGERLVSQGVTLAPGTQLVRAGGTMARQIIAVTRPLLMLQLTLEPRDPQPAREIALNGTGLLKTISGCRVTSQAIMAINVLGALGHRAAVPELVRVARECSGARELRWEALRHALALDARAGLALLAELAAAPGDPLAQPAAALQRQLAATRPDLAAVMVEAA